MIKNYFHTYSYYFQPNWILGGGGIAITWRWYGYYLEMVWILGGGMNWLLLGGGIANRWRYTIVLIRVKIKVFIKVATTRCAILHSAPLRNCTLPLLLAQTNFKIFPDNKKSKGSGK